MLLQILKFWVLNLFKVLVHVSYEMIAVILVMNLRINNAFIMYVYYKRADLFCKY